MDSISKPPAIAIFCDCRLTPRDAVSNSMVDMYEALIARGFAVTLAARANHRDPSIPCRVIADESALEALFREHSHLLYHYTIGDELSARVNQATSLKRAMYFHGVTPPELLEADAPEIAALCRQGLTLLDGLNRFNLYAANSRFNARLLPRPAGIPEPRILAPYLRLHKVSGRPTPTAGPYLLYLGRFFPHKNVEGVIQFFAEAAGEDPQLRLVLAGSQSTDVLLTSNAYLTRLQRQIREAGLMERVEFRFNRSDEECADLIAGAKAMVSFSRHEGFGVPLVEAMANGVPVISHRVAAIPEVMGEAALYREDFPSAREAYRALSLERDRWACAGRARFQERYTDERVQQQFAAFMDEFIA